MQIILKTEKRKNTFVPGREEWAFVVQFVGRPQWTLTTWKQTPTQDDINMATSLMLRSFEVYHDTFMVPSYSVDVVKA